MWNDVIGKTKEFQTFHATVLPDDYGKRFRVLFGRTRARKHRRFAGRGGQFVEAFVATTRKSRSSFSVTDYFRNTGWISIRQM